MLWNHPETKLDLILWWGTQETRDQQENDNYTVKSNSFTFTPRQWNEYTTRGENVHSEWTKVVFWKPQKHLLKPHKLWFLTYQNCACRSGVIAFPSLNTSPVSNLYLFDSWIKCCFPLTNPWTSAGLFPVLCQQQELSMACAIYTGQSTPQRAPHGTELPDSRSNATTSRWQLLHSIYEQVPGIALPAPPHEENGYKWVFGETSRHLHHRCQALQRKANQLQPTWEMAELANSLAKRGGVTTKISEMQCAGKTAALLTQQSCVLSDFG